MLQKLEWLSVLVTVWLSVLITIGMDFSSPTCGLHLFGLFPAGGLSPLFELLAALLGLFPFLDPRVGVGVGCGTLSGFAAGSVPCRSVDGPFFPFLPFTPTRLLLFFFNFFRAVFLEEFILISRVIMH